MNNWTLDLAVQNAKYVDDDPSKGVIVTVANLRPLVLPATLQVNYKDGTHDRIKIPVEAWLTKGAANFTFHGDKPVTTVVIDPDHVLPDDDRTNNTFTLP
jgi:hypothetical protein